MDIVERLKLLLKAKKVSRPKLGKMTHVSAERWASVVNRKVNVRIDEILEVCELWPMYRHWLIFGEELPESGQISPITEAIALQYLSDAEAQLDEDDFYRKTMLKHVPSLGWLNDNFVTRIDELDQFYKSEKFKELYSIENESRAKRLDRIRKNVLKMDPNSELSAADVIALEWLEFLTKSGVDRGYIF
ncbi:Uncharacterised protein [BD1-7 clade bacterium]|uniref:Uncharacterized protein n=1 Tax=BD1-7 clade bacterium TaxID=2029982 RepID=A0A5S9PAQ1_9GAMM|nr:Uncharacterised protein [BD1-7 clade bacterium]CAA0101675.1 Uncharacterised protein [BD1-7 clade bacterium]